MSDLRLRVLSAAVMGPIVLGLAWLGGPAFGILALVAALLFLHEWFAMTGTGLSTPHGVAGYLVLVGLAIAYHFGYPGVSLACPIIGALAVYGLSGFNRAGRWAAEGLIYGGLALYALLVIRGGEQGLVFLFFLLVLVWTTDIAAYFTGRSLGGPKLWRKISPNKTWSGAIGGLVCAVLLGLGTAAIAGKDDLFNWALLAAVLSVVSQLGDLLESGVKRRFNVKDSSHLIPGHGGIMDRVDGLVAAAIAAVALGFLFGGSVADPISGLALG
ncbi:phosphatidate cytidylyltransferase [Labrenzia aggregata]|uniref:Phosphatidate cytidylyltransferase n=2 Tax=Roseibium aggregatum TaxID=187304 RepID=A0A926S8K8_9HYPH|nr:phosphatidate cytidylyltransferase [Roseibium aggregatum]